MMEANLKSIQTLCHGCLSADRDLSPIGELCRMFTKICDRKARVPGLKYTSLCWECMATLKRMQLFHKQVKTAQNILKFYIRTKDLQKSLPKTLSRLKATRTNHYFISLIESDQPELDIKLLDEIKEEEDHDEDKEFICEFEPYEPELDIKVTEHDKEDFIEEDDAHDEENYFNQEEVEETNMEQEEEKDNEQEDDTDISDASNEEKDLKEDSNFVVKLKDIKQKALQQTENGYYSISTAEEMCVKEQARPSDLDNLWGSVQGLSVSQETVYRCLVCGHRSPSMEAAGQHVTQHTNIFKCRLCEFCCLRPGVARSHNRIAHMKFSCDYCGKNRLSKFLIQQHISRHHMVNKCKLCPRTYSNYERLKKHMKVVHDEVDQSDETFCVKCNKQFKNSQRLLQHLRGSVIHADEYGRVQKRVKCLACDKQYTKRSIMMKHYQFVHLGICKFYCSICDKGYQKSDKYTNHMRYKHEGAQRPRDKICDVCGRGFTEKMVLENHMRTHTGERPFACAVCDARFAQKVARNMHQKRHCRQNKACSSY